MRRRFEEQRLEEDRGVYDDAVTGLSDARSAERAASEAYDADLAAWARASRSVDTQEVVDALGLPPFEPDRVEAVVNGLRTDVQTGYAVAVRDLEGVRQEIVDRQSSLLEEQSSLEAGHKPDPEAPVWRDERDGRPGAPLWHLVELAPGVEAGAIDGVEAALAASGLLDAWVSPDGVIDVSAHDLELVPGGQGKAGESTLADLLVPLTGAAVASDRVAAVLASIPVDPHVGPAATGDGPEVLMGDGRLLPAGQRGGPGPGRTSDAARRRGPGAPATPTAVRGGRGPGRRWIPNSTGSNGPGTSSTGSDRRPRPISTPFPHRYPSARPSGPRRWRPNGSSTPRPGSKPPPAGSARRRDRCARRCGR